MNIYVSNINFRTENENFFNLFSSFGEVTSARIITDRETGRSRGFGFVEMANESEGQSAIDALNGTEFEGKIINVSVARPKEDHRENRGYRNDRGNGHNDGYRSRNDFGNGRDRY